MTPNADVEAKMASFRVGGELDAAQLRAWLDTLSPRERKRFLKRANKNLRYAEAELERERANLDRYIERYEEAGAELTPWMGKPRTLEKPDGSAIHHLLKDLIDGDSLFLGLNKNFTPADFVDAIEGATSFLIEHDWAGAFAGATDFEDGEFRLPYEVCTFEFRITGWRVVALMTTVDDRVLMQLLVRGSKHWIIDDDISRHENGKWGLYHAGRSPDKNYFQPLAEFVGAQVRAVSIALDAEVAEHEVIRVPEKLARARERAGKAPMLPYHVVSLAHRTRAVPAPAGGESEHGKRRLHFRRGHWRHLASHKVWVRWCLVGNPELGFVDKHYRL